MNPLEKIATSLEMSRLIQDAGIDFESALVWVKTWENKIKIILRKDLSDTKTEKQIIPAPTTDEMIERLPDKIIIEKHIYYLELIKVCGIYAAQYNLNSCSWLKIMESNTPKEALAKLCLWCKKERYL